MELLHSVKSFLNEKEKLLSELENESWLSDLMFFTDIMEHLQAHNLILQGKGKFIVDVSQKLLSFEAKLRLFIRDLQSKTFSYFPRLKTN